VADGPMLDPVSREDRRWLARAIALGETARGLTSPNPAVGCVLVSGGRIVGEGATRPAGGPHAEAVALAEAGATARGATAYVTLEPCAHHGRTPPCADALVAAGVLRVVYIASDPNPLATGGPAVLEAGDVEVVGPLPHDDLFRGIVAAQLEGFLTTVTTRRPHLTLKVAQTADGQLVAPGGRWVTGPQARRAVHRWRASVDAVLVGIGTVLADDPRLDVRHVPTERQPRAVIVDSRLRTPTDAAVVRPGTLIVTTAAADGSRTRALRAAGVDVEVVASDGDRVDLRAATAALARYGTTSVLAEPGHTLAQALLDADLVDRLVVHVGGGVGGIVVVPALAPAPGTVWRLERSGGVGADAIIQQVRVRETRSDGKAA
jgi:diaminohydroxyphosphoribosylaminopyrimidine deaminase / 5-amino-6-(5-phosphoribosylamino)uracil reductase